MFNLNPYPCIFFLGGGGSFGGFLVIFWISDMLAINFRKLMFL